MSTSVFVQSGLVPSVVVDDLSLQMGRLQIQSGVDVDATKRGQLLSARRREKNYVSLAASSLAVSALAITPRSVSPTAGSLRLTKGMVLPSLKEMRSAKVLCDSSLLSRISSFLLKMPKTENEGLEYFLQDGIALYFVSQTINKKMCEVTKGALSYIREVGLIEQMILQKRYLPKFFRKMVTKLSFQNIDFSLLPQMNAFSFLQLAGAFPNIADLALRKCGISRAHLESLDAFQNLRKLKLYEDDLVTDDGIEGASNVLKSLRELVLYGCSNVTNKSVRAIAQHAKNITVLSLAYTSISSLEDIPKMIVLNELSLAGCMKVHDAMLIYLPQCGLLKSLDLSRCTITDRGLQHLAKIKLLNDLSLNNCRSVTEGFFCCKTTFKITYEGVSQALLQHSHLQSVQANGMEATAEEIAALRRYFSQKIVREANPQEIPRIEIYNRREARGKRHVYMLPAGGPAGTVENKAPMPSFQLQHG